MRTLPRPGDGSKVDFSVNRQLHAHSLVPMTRDKEETEQIVLPVAMWEDPPKARSMRASRTRLDVRASVCLGRRAYDPEG